MEQGTFLGEAVRLATLPVGVALVIAFWYMFMSRLNLDESSHANSDDELPWTTRGPLEELRSYSLMNRSIAWFSIICTVVIGLIGALLFVWVLLRYGFGETGV